MVGGFNKPKNTNPNELWLSNDIMVLANPYMAGLPKRVIFGAVLFCLAVLGLQVLRQRIHASSVARENHFLSVYCLVMESIRNDPENTQTELADLLRIFPVESDLLLKPFRNGLTYKRTEKGFQLHKPQPERISLFQRDRLVSTESERPYWEASGIKARKG